MLTTTSYKFAFAISLLGLTVSALPAYGQATPAGLSISDGVNTVTIDGSGAATCTAGTCTTLSTAGTISGTAIQWMGSIGAFDLNAILSIQGTGNFDINLNGVNATGGGMITVLYTVTGVSGEGPYALSQSPNFGLFSGTETFTAFADTSDTPFALTTNLYPAGPLTSNGGTTQILATGLSGPSSAAMSITGKVVLTETGGLSAFVTDDFVLVSPYVPVSLTCSGINTSGVVGTPFNSGTPTATGGTGTLTFSTTPPLTGSGLTQDTQTGIISGTPTAGGTFSIVVTDANGATATGCPITIMNSQSQGPGPLSVGCPTGTATVGVPYSATVPISGGVTPYKAITVSAGALPAGLSVALNAAGTVATISGTPTAAGSNAFTIKVVDNAGTIAYSTCSGSCTTTTTTSSVNFNSPTGNLNSSHTYMVSGTTVTAYGFAGTSTGTGTPTAIDGQNNSGTANDGIGIVSGTSGDIDTSHFIQLDFTQAKAAGATNGKISISGVNSCNNGESYRVYGSNTLGSLGTLLYTGSLNATYFAIPSFSTYKYIGVIAKSGAVLISQISFNLPGPTCNITVACPPVPKISLKKTASVSKANPFQEVTYTYTVTNTGAVPLTNVKIVDDNATPDYPGDDVTVASNVSLAVGASQTFTETLIPPVNESGTPQSPSGWGNYGWGSGSNNNGYGNSRPPAGTLICSKLSNGNYQITFRQDPGQTDNTYGRGTSSSWGSGYGWNSPQRNFSDMLGGQAAEFKFLDKNGSTVLDVSADYISQSRNFPSGYGTLGIGGGNGSVISGSGSNVISCDTTLSHNLNQSSNFYQCTKDSPVNSSGWDNVSGYTIVVAGKTFGSAGFGGVAIPDCHNQHNIQTGCDDQKVSPTSSYATNTATVTATGGSVTVSASAKATVQIDASSTGWKQCSKY